MSFSWEERHNRPLGAPAYGGSGAIDLSAIYNDPRFAETVQDAVRRVATMRGAFPHGSIDPRALMEVPVLATLPPRQSRYPGMQVRYDHNPGEDNWLLQWEPLLKGGEGAWAVRSAGHLFAETDGTERTTSSTTPVALTGGPDIDIPAGGRYVLMASAELANALNPYTAMVTVTGPGIDSGNFIIRNPAKERFTLTRVGEATFTGPGTVSLLYATDDAAGTASFWLRAMSLLPIEVWD